LAGVDGTVGEGGLWAGGRFVSKICIVLWTIVSSIHNSINTHLISVPYSITLPSLCLYHTSVLMLAIICLSLIYRFYMGTDGARVSVCFRTACHVHVRIRI
jgi:hypothetical protein